MELRFIKETARRLMRHAAVPYHEDGVIGEVMAICRELKLPATRDLAGNVMVTFRRGKPTRPLVMAAHMDHPGFEVLRSSGPGRWEARFLGGVGDKFFKHGLGLRLYPGNRRATLGKRIAGPKHFEILSRGAGPASAEFAVWDLIDFKTQRGLIQGRACDDLVGVSSVLAVLAGLKKSRRHGYAVGLITRAEEVGFHGALAAVKQGLVPPEALVVSLETSQEMPPVRMGSGVIVRVGDKTSIFDTQATRFLTLVAEEVGRTDSKFRYQRALMSGGTCEATVFQEYRHTTAALCVALGNYHNCGPRNRIAEEFVNLEDVSGMVKLLQHAVWQMRDYEVLVGRLPRRLKEMGDAAMPRLEASKKRG